MEKVRAHVKKSGVAVQSYLRARDTKGSKRKSPQTKPLPQGLTQLAEQNLKQDIVLDSIEFPHPHYRHVDWETDPRMAVKNFKISKNDLLIGIGMPPLSPKSAKKQFLRKTFIDPKFGEGVMVIGGLEAPTLQIGPNSVVDRVEYTHRADLRGTNMPSSLFNANLFRRTDFRGAILDGSRFGSAINEKGEREDRVVRGMSKVRFDGASLRNTEFELVNFRQVSFRGADLTGAKFINSGYGTLSSPGDIDLTDSNVTAHQVLQLTRIQTSDPAKGVPRKLSDHGIVYREHSFEEVCELAGLTEKQFEYFVISKVFEVRDDHFKLITSDFDPDKHHIPQWSVQRWLHAKSYRP